jgi:hypothetical protein
MAKQLERVREIAMTAQFKVFLPEEQNIREHALNIQE